MITISQWHFTHVLLKMSSDKARTALIAAELSKCLPEERKVWLKLLLISEAPPPSGRPIMEKIISSVAGIDEDALKAKAEQAGHGSLVIEEMWPKNMARSHPVAVDKVLSLYENGGLDGALAGMSGKEVAWVWRVVDRRLFARIGARVVLNALHKDAFSGTVSQVYDCALLTMIPFFVLQHYRHVYCCYSFVFVKLLIHRSLQACWLPH